jgi:putative ABC transport system substrate-binding protein
MRRREFLGIVGAAAAVPLAARAQPADRMRRIGWMDSFREDDANARARAKAFWEVLERLGWRVGGNLAIDYRWGLFDVEKAQRAGAELLKLMPDVFLCGGSPSALAMQQATRTIPIVFAFVTDPVGQGLVPNLAHPGSNITGFSYFEPAVGAKWLELLKEIAPRVTRVAVMFNPVSSPYSPLYYQSIAAAGPKFGVETATELVREPADIERIMAKLGSEPGSGVILSADAFLYTNNNLIVELAKRHRLPSIHGSPGTAADGGLIYYCVDIVDLWRKATAYADRILRGEKPADLPVQQPTKFEMTINLKTAKALGLTVPNTLLVSADGIIE